MENFIIKTQEDLHFYLDNIMKEFFVENTPTEDLDTSGFWSIIEEDKEEKNKNH